MILGSAKAKQSNPVWALSPADDDAELISKMITGSRHYGTEAFVHTGIKTDFCLPAFGSKRQNANTKYSGKSQC
jgi:hypothetical protein